jgi:hypothetical protein
MMGKHYALLLTALLTGCGGGGDSSSLPPPPPPPSSLSYTAPPPFNVGTAIAQLAPTVTGSVASYTVAPALPAGISINAGTGIITGTPSAITTTTNYVVTAANSSGNTTATLSLTVKMQLPTISYGATSFSYTTGTAANQVATSSGGAVDSWAIDRALPAGLAFNTSTGAITGTPTAATPAANYVVTATNAGGTGTTTLTLTVDPSPPAVTYGLSSFEFTTGVAVNVIPASTGGGIATWSVDRALPAGLALNPITGVIDGTPVQTAMPATYVVTAQNTRGIDTVNLSIAVAQPDTGVLLRLGHLHGDFPIVHDGSRIMSGSPELIALWNAQSGGMIASTSITCEWNSPCGQEPMKWAMHGPTAVVRRAEGFEVWSTADGTVLAFIAWPAEYGSWWRLAADGSYVVAGNSTGVMAWSPTGTLLFQRAGAHNAAKAFAAAGELRIAMGPAGNNVIEHVTIPAGTSTVTPAFLGTFHSWFMDGESFFSNTGNTVWVYTPSAVQRDLVALPTIAGLGGQDDWLWTKTEVPAVLQIYRVGAGATPASTYNLSPSNAVMPSTGTIGIVESTPAESRQISVVDLSGATPVRRDYTSPFPYLRSFASASANDWVYTNMFGVMLGEPGRPTKYSLGLARSIAGSDSRIAIATASGSIFYYDANSRQLQGEIEFTSGKIQLSADGNVLTASAEDGYSQYATDRTLKVFSLPSETLLGEWPHSYPTDMLWDFSLSFAGTHIGQVTSATDNLSVTNSVTLLDGTPVWTYVPPPLPYGTSERIPIHISPDGTRIALADHLAGQATASNIYLNGILSSAASGYALGWADNNRLLLNRYNSQGGYTGVDLVQANGQLITGLLPLPESFEMQQLSGNRIYLPGTNEVYDLATGNLTWSSQAPHANPGAVAGPNVVFTSNATVRIEPL